MSQFCDYCGVLLREEPVNGKCIPCWRKKTDLSKTETKKLIREGTKYLMGRTSCKTPNDSNFTKK